MDLLAGILLRRSGGGARRRSESEAIKGKERMSMDESGMVLYSLCGGG